jgi:hypothetical protein
MPIEVTLNEGNSVTLDINGNGKAKCGPISSREVWNPANAHVNVSTNNNEATCGIYVGNSGSPNEFRDETFSGSSGDSTDKISADTIKCGSYVIAIWTGGDPGAQAQLNVTGTKTL